MEDKDNLIRVFNSIAERLEFHVRLIEKDYYLTRVLQKLAQSRIDSLIFKGGTCLNKCYLGFYRLSEDLDFVYNRDVSKFSATQVKKILDSTRRKFFSILSGLNIRTDKALGRGWKMLTARIPQKFVGVEIIGWYVSLIDSTEQTIKIEVSFRKKLVNPSVSNVIKHEFYNDLGEPVLPDNVSISCIALEENFAEKFRALATRKNIAIRDIYDLYYILKNRFLSVNDKIISTILLKINESRHFTKKDLIGFISSLTEDKVSEEELKSVIKTGEIIDVKRMLGLIKGSFDKV